MKANYYCLFFLLLLTACHRKMHTVARGFYYWKTTYQLTPYERQRLGDAVCQRLYLRCFDVDWDAAANAPRPVAMLRMQQPLQPGLQYVPVVFITQPAIAHLDERAASALAANMAQLLAGQCASSGIRPDEIQIDCDWTAGSRAAYFSLLRSLRAQPFFRQKILSCTVRLHQVKYQLQSGIPPADRALVMCYNIGNLKQPGAHNSILDASLAKNYLAHLDRYPLPVDIALPLYSWCLQFRKGRLAGILRDVPPEAVQRSPLFEKLEGNVYRCGADTSWYGFGLLSGDEIRVESPSLADITAVANFTSKQVRNDSLRVLFFHTDSLTLSKYSTHDLEAVYRAYH